MRRPPDTPLADQLDPTLDFLRLLWGIETGLHSASKRMAASVGVTGPQRLVLRLVSRFPGISPTEVAGLMRLHPSTITGVLHRLEDKGLLARDRHAADRRRARLRVTPAAARLARGRAGTVEAVVARALARVPPASVAHARGVLAAIIDALEAGRV